MVTLPASTLDDNGRFSRYNSPYAAHDGGAAVDLYPEDDVAPSPVAGEVLETRRVQCPSRPHAESHDYLVVVDTGTFLARILHVEPSVDPGDTVARGDSLGRLVRSGYFAPWVDDHVHLGLRPRGANVLRATGSLPLTIDVPVEPVPWDGTGRVVATGDTYALLDAPDHPDPGGVFAGIADGTGQFVLDGGLPHYEWGGRLAPDPADRRRDQVVVGDSSPAAKSDPSPVSLLGTRVGTATGESVRWRNVDVLVDGEPILGLSFVLGRERVAAKLVERDRDFAVGAAVSVAIDG
ncbi:MAG: hypothetical protein ABEJ44_01500 [Halanaeroarchaeum sp.]